MLSSVRSTTTPLVLLLGAGAYGFSVEALGLTFNATPLFCGAVVLVAAAGRRELVPPALALVGWGASVLLVREGGLPDDREAGAFLVGATAGLLAAYALGRLYPRIARGMGGAIATVLAGGLALY